MSAARKTATPEVEPLALRGTLTIAATSSIGAAAARAEALGLNVQAAKRNDDGAIELSVDVPPGALAAMEDALVSDQLVFRSKDLSDALSSLWARDIAFLSANASSYSNERWKPHACIRGTLRQEKRRCDLANRGCDVLEELPSVRGKRVLFVELPAGLKTVFHLKTLAVEHVLGELSFEPAEPNHIDVDFTPEQGAAAFWGARRLLMATKTRKDARFLASIAPSGYGLLLALLVVYYSRRAR